MQSMIKKSFHSLTDFVFSNWSATTRSASAEKWRGEMRLVEDERNRRGCLITFPVWPCAE
jgi:hypothetical protein